MENDQKKSKKRNIKKGFQSLLNENRKIKKKRKIMILKEKRTKKENLGGRVYYRSFSWGGFLVCFCSATASPANQAPMQLSIYFGVLACCIQLHRGYFLCVSVCSRLTLNEFNTSPTHPVNHDQIISYLVYCPAIFCICGCWLVCPYSTW